MPWYQIFIVPYNCHIYNHCKPQLNIEPQTFFGLIKSRKQLLSKGLQNITLNHFINHEFPAVLMKNQSMEHGY